MGKIYDALEKSEKTRMRDDADRSSSTRRIVSKNDEVPQPIPLKNREVEPAPLLREMQISGPNADIDENLILYYAPHSKEAEIFRQLRTNVLFPSSKIAAVISLVVVFPELPVMATTLR